MGDRLSRLPAVYAEFLALRRLGLDDAAVAGRLGVPTESLPLLARLAEAKLGKLAPVPDGSAGSGSSPCAKQTPHDPEGAA